MTQEGLVGDGGGTPDRAGLHHAQDIDRCVEYTRGRPGRQALMWVYYFRTNHARGGDWEEWALVAMRQHPNIAKARTSTVLSVTSERRNDPDDRFGQFPFP